MIETKFFISFSIFIYIVANSWGLANEKDTAFSPLSETVKTGILCGVQCIYL